MALSSETSRPHRFAVEDAVAKRARIAAYAEVPVAEVAALVHMHDDALREADRAYTRLQEQVGRVETELQAAGQANAALQVQIESLSTKLADALTRLDAIENAASHTSRDVEHWRPTWEWAWHAFRTCIIAHANWKWHQQESKSRLPSGEVMVDDGAQPQQQSM